MGLKREEESITIMTVLFMMENLKVGLKIAEEFLSILMVLFMMENLNGAARR